MINFVYPNGNRKAVTFTMDDGNVPMDRKFIEIISPYRIKGTFNLCSSELDYMSREEYLKLYSGYEIANHCKYHPYVLLKDMEKPIKYEPFSYSDSDENYMYPYKDAEDIFLCHLPHGWRVFAREEKYKSLVTECTAELEEVFGKGKIRGYVWPFCEQKSENVFDFIKGLGFYGIRTVGRVGSKTGFSLPKDRNCWSYNADHTTLLSCMKEYEEYPDDKRLKLFAFGVHTVDFDRSGCWDELVRFARLYGAREDEYWYASVGEIFDYEDATRLVAVDNGKLTNNSSIDVYFEHRGKIIKLEKGHSIEI